MNKQKCCEIEFHFAECLESTNSMSLHIPFPTDCWFSLIFLEESLAGVCFNIYSENRARRVGWAFFLSGKQQAIKRLQWVKLAGLESYWILGNRSANSLS